MNKSVNCSCFTGGWCQHSGRSTLPQWGSTCILLPDLRAALPDFCPLQDPLPGPAETPQEREVYTVATRDPVVAEQMRFIASRSDVGYDKYKVGLDREDLSIPQWLTHAREEATDLANYLARVTPMIEALQAENEALRAHLQQLTGTSEE